MYIYYVLIYIYIPLVSRVFLSLLSLISYSKFVCIFSLSSLYIYIYIYYENVVTLGMTLDLNSLPLMVQLYNVINYYFPL